MQLEIDLPAVIPDLPNDAYHAQRQFLSASGVRRLLDTCPERFRYEQDHPDESEKKTKALLAGSVVHAWILEGEEIAAERYVQLPEDHNGATKDGKARLAEIAEAEKIAVPWRIYKDASGMYDAFRRHPIYALFESGLPEVSIFWKDTQFDLSCRARIDWLPESSSVDGFWRRVVPDYKTAESAHPREIKNSMANYEYHIQAAWYLDGIRACGLREDPVFRFVFQEKTAPYLVTICELDEDALDIAKDKITIAKDIYKRCLDSRTWPGYAEDVTIVGLPFWYYRAHGWNKG